MLIKEMYILEDVEVSPFNVMDGRLFENVIYYDKITDLLSLDLSHVAIRAVNLYKFIYVQQLNQNIDIITYTRNRSKTISQASFKYITIPTTFICMSVWLTDSRKHREENNDAMLRSHQQWRSCI